MIKSEMAELLADVLNRVSEAQAIAASSEDRLVADKLNAIGGLLVVKYPELGTMFYNVEQFHAEDFYD